MTRPIRRRTVIGTRPTQAPHGYIVYNAPRPLFGVEWRGDFISGVFFAALDPQGSDFAKLHEMNRQQDAVILTYISEDECFAAGRERLAAEYPDQTDVLDAPRNREWVLSNQLEFINSAQYRTEVAQ